MLDANWDQPTDTWYFSQGREAPIVNTIDLGGRHVRMDVDPYGRIIGIEVH